MSTTITFKIEKTANRWWLVESAEFEHDSPFSQETSWIDRENLDREIKARTAYFRVHGHNTIVVDTTKKKRAAPKSSP